MEDFVTYEIAVKLKEKGFNVECHAYYEPLKHCLNLSRVFKTNSLVENYHCITAPTISQVLKWLREEKKLHIAIDIWGRTWGYDIIELPSGNSLHWTAYCKDIKSYEDASLNGIEYVIDNLI